MTGQAGSAPPGARLEAAAISIRMIAAKAGDGAPYVPVVAHRFAVDEAALRDAIGARTTTSVYERIHSNGSAAEAGTHRARGVTRVSCGP